MHGNVNAYLRHVIGRSSSPNKVRTRYHMHAIDHFQILARSGLCMEKEASVNSQEYNNGTTCTMIIIIIFDP